MRVVLAGCILFLSVGLLVAGGSIPKKADMPKYIETINNQSASAKAKTEAADMIGRRGAISSKDVEAAIEPLKKLALKDKDAAVRAAAVGALGGIAPEPKETVPLLIQVLKNDQSQPVKFATVTALGRYGPEAKSALPAIREFGATLDKKDKKKIQAATQAITGNKK